MDMNTLIDQILARVAEKMTQTEAAPCACGAEKKPRLLILTREHGTHCHEMLESKALCGSYDTACALLQDYQVDVQDYDAVILYGLTIEVLSKLASGACDTPFTSLAAKALLLGKRVFVPTEEVELYRYASTAPAAYYAMMEEKLRLLTASGVIICAQANLESAILSGAPASGCSPCSSVEAPAAVTPTPTPCKEVKEKALSKRVIIEHDILVAKEEGATVLRISPKSILTDLARDMAKDQRIQVIRG